MESRKEGILTIRLVPSLRGSKCFLRHTEDLEGRFQPGYLSA